MPMPIHCSVEGLKQGQFKGDVTMRGREGTILVDGLKHDVVIPVNPQNGQPTGKRVHQPLMITKIIDPSSPMFYLALCTGEPLKVTLKWYRQSGSIEEHYFTTQLEDAIVVSIKEYIPCVFERSMEQYQHMEDVQLTYKKIIWTHEVAGKQSQDTWEEPAQ